MSEKIRVKKSDSGEGYIVTVPSLKVEAYFECMDDVRDFIYEMNSIL